MVAATGVIVAAIFYILNMRATYQTRQAQLFMPIYSKITEKDFMKDGWEILDEWEWTNLDDFEKKYLADRDNRGKFWAFSDYWEGVGVLVKRKLIDPKLVDDMMSSGIMMFWEKMSPVIMELRVRHHMPQLNEHAEYLYHEVKPIAERQNPGLKPSP
jgi:hypothetical protein